MSPVRLLDRLVRDRQTVAVAESCTGGLLSARLTEHPGASAVFLGGVVSYADDAKLSLLGVDERIIRESGSVSAACVGAMAHGARERFHSTLAIAVSGIAGPSGGSAAKPVGTVWIAALGPGPLLNVHRLDATGERAEVRRQAVEQAIRLLERNLAEAEKEGLAPST